MKNQNSLFYKYEFVLFAAFLFINLLPIALFKFLPTLDGPSHLHNANLIKNLLFTDSDFLNKFYQLNNELLPNWSGHFILALFNSFFPAWIADKILILIYLILLPVSFRWFVKSINPNNYLLSYLIFPFCYSFTFFLGFYNFSLALVLLFLLLGFWIKMQEKIQAMNIAILFILFTTLYFSHVFVFFIAIMATGVIVLKQLAIDNEKTSFHNSFQLFFKRIAIIVLTSGLGLFLSLKFLLSRTAFNYSYIPKIELLKWIRDIRPTVVFNFGHETVYTRILFYLIVLLTIAALVQKVNDIIKSKPRFADFIVSSVKQNDLWFVFSFFLLLFYFFMPDSNGYSGYFTVRMVLLLYLFYIVWIAIQKYPRWLLILSISVVFLTNFGLNFYYIKQIRHLNNLALEINNQSKFIDDYKVVLPINFSTNWMHGHFSNYLGIDKPIVILENYECGTGYFPVKWSNDFPNTTVGNRKNSEFCINWKTNTESLNQYPIDYIFILGNTEELNNPCAKKTMQLILSEYQLILQTKNTQQFKLKESN
ncbi:MAG: hypothetical protein AB7S50_15545 [Bacteroidales bacterium]